MNLTRALAILALLFAVGGFARAQSIHQIHFAPGTTGTVIDGAIVRGGTEKYGLEARAGQRMSVRIGSVEGNAVFTIYEPSSYRAISRQEATSWDGRLPASGMYIIEVASERGNASFRLRVQIR